MRRFLCIVLFIAAWCRVDAQDIVSDFLKGKERNTEKMYVSISGKMLQLMAESDPKADKEFLKLLKDISKVKFVSGFEMEGDDRKKLNKLLEAYEELMVVTEEDKISMFTKEKKGKIVEFVLCIESDDHLVLMSITGDLDVKKLSKLAKNVKIDGMEHLEKLEDKPIKK